MHTALHVKRNTAFLVAQNHKDTHAVVNTAVVDYCYCVKKPQADICSCSSVAMPGVRSAGCTRGAESKAQALIECCSQCTDPARDDQVSHGMTVLVTQQQTNCVWSPVSEA